MKDYNYKPLTVERLRQSAEKIDENNRLGIGGAAWQRGIQEWAADAFDELQKRGGSLKAVAVQHRKNYELVG